MTISTSLRNLSAIAASTAFVAGVLVSPGEAEAAVMAIGSSLALEATANAGGGVITDTDIDPQSNTVNPFTASVSAFAEFENASVLSTAEARATWVDASQGEVVFSNVGWDIANVEAGGEATLFNGTDWTYTFVSDADGVFTLDFNVFASPETTSDFGLNGFEFGWSGPEGGNFLNLNSSGTLTRTVTAGDTFTVNIQNSANIFGGLGTRTAFMDGIFNWSIVTEDTADVPEPASMLGLLAVGALGAGSTLKRKSAQKA